MSVPEVFSDAGGEAVRRPVDLLSQVGYGAGQIAGQVFRDLPSLLLLFFMTSVLGVAPAVAGAAIFVPKLIFGISGDMLVGVLSDRWRRRLERRWWLLAGAVGAPVAMVLLFHVPAVGSTLQLVWVVASFTLYMLVFAVFSVPYLAIAGEMTADSEQRTVIMAWRLVFTAVGLLTAGALAPAIIDAHGGGQAAYERMALVLAVICPLALLVAFFGARRAAGQSGFVQSTAPRLALTLREALMLLSIPRFSVLLSATLLQLTGAGMAYASLLYFLIYNMGRSDAFQIIGVVVGLACAGIVVAQPMWVAVARHLGKRRAYVLGSFIYALCYGSWSLLADAPLWVIYVLAFVGAMGNSGWAMLGFSMLSDIAAEDQHHAGLYSAAWIAADKVAFALGGTLLVGLVLGVFGFDSARAVAGLEQAPLALTGIMLSFGVVPALLNIGGALLLWRFGRN
jgi:GPH family glycoside/pentoside/hexuronide:cation symporter